MTEKISIGVALIVGPDRLEQVKRLLPQLVSFDQIVVVNTSGQGSVNNYVKNLSKKHKGKFEVHDITWRPSVYKPVPFYGISEVPEHAGKSIDARRFETFTPQAEPVEREMYGMNEWGFAYARNESFKHLKTTHAVWIDTDDLIGVKYDNKHVPLPPSGIADHFRRFASEAPDVDVWFMDYIYSQDENGNVNVLHARERMVKMASNWKWVYPIHECLAPGMKPKHSIIKDIEFIHLPTEQDPGVSADRNMKMLRDWYEQLKRFNQEHDMQRCRLLIGDTLWGQERFREAAAWLEFEFLAKHPNAITLEKWQAATFAAKSYIACGNLKHATNMALKAIDFEPGLPDGYYLLAEIKLLAEEDPQDILQLIDTASRMDDPPPQTIKNPLDYTFTPFCIVSQCKFEQGLFEIALDFAVKALKIRPNDERAERLRSQAASGLRERDATRAAASLYQYLSDFDEHEKALALYNILPTVVQKQDEIHKIAENANTRAAHILNPDRYVEIYSDPPDWKPVPFNFFEEGKIPGRDRYEYILRRLKMRPEIKNILWVGSDDGFHATLLALAGYKVIGVDLNKEGVRIANERAEKLGVDAKFMELWFELFHPDETINPFTGESFQHGFDAIIASEQIDRARDLPFFMETLGDCAKDDAPIIITTPSGAWDQGDIPVSRDAELARAVRVFTQDALERLLTSNPDYSVNECHFLPYTLSYRKDQGWQVAEIQRTPRASGPVIRILCGELVEPFNPDNLIVGGIGGSETAVIHMAGYWAKMGCVVGVYGSNVGIYDGVLYRHADDWMPELKSDVFISWRLPHLFEKWRPNATLNVLWCHDLYYPIDIQPEWMDRIDLIAVLSEFHKKYIMGVHPFTEDKMWVTRNGIDPKRFMQKVERKPHHYFFSSSHERGLEELVLMWPKIKEAIPDAVLHVGYGTHTAASIMKDRRDFEALDELRGLEMLMYEIDGIQYHGRMNQWELAKVQLGCEAWLYPFQSDEKWMGHGGFLETYCITALEAQAAGCVPITRLNGALGEVIKNRIVWTESLKVEGLIDTLLHLNELFTPKQIEENRKWALSQSWETLAVEWLKHFLQREENNELIPDPVRDLVGTTTEQ